MQRYRNLSGNSGVIAFEIGDDSIAVRFRDGDIYLYTVESAGRGNIEEMKRLAMRGQGLASFISRVTRNMYASKL